MARTKKTKTTASQLPKRDITSFVTKQMLSGNISILKIARCDIEKALERYCEENPKVDATNIPLVGIYNRNGNDAEAKAIISLAKKYCGTRGSRTAIFSPDGNGAIIFGKSAKEIVSKISTKGALVEYLKTKMKIKCGFPVDRKLNCFGGEKVSDHMK